MPAILLTMSDPNEKKSQGEPEVSILRRRLPHWAYQDSIYFVTWRLHKEQYELCPDERDLIASALNHFNGTRYHLFCYVVMNDHVHVLFRPEEKDPVSKIMHSWKSFAAHQLQRGFNRKGRIWQEEYYDRIIRNEREFYNTARYIMNNPWKRWATEEYRWAWFRPPEEDGGHGGPPYPRDGL